MAGSARTSEPPQRYLIALGSNRRHGRFGMPREVLGAVPRALEKSSIKVEVISEVFETAPVGPSQRRYANAAAIVSTHLLPPALLDRLKQIEREFGRRTGGARWGDRVLDLDIVLWEGGTWSDPGLIIPHVEFHNRRFVLDPAAAIAGGWRDPITGHTLRQLHARLTRPRPLPR